MAICEALNDDGLNCVDESGHAGPHWFQMNANICDSRKPEDSREVCTLGPNHQGAHRYHRDVTTRGSIARIFRMDDDPEFIRQREIDALNPPPDPMAPDNSDLMDHAESLPVRDQVALWAGRILRKEAQIESMLQMIHYELSGGGLSHVVVPSLFGRLLDDVVKMLKAAQIEDATYISDSLAALSRLKAVHQLRNRVVHDQWVERQVAPGQFVMVNAPKGLTAPGSHTELEWGVSEFRQAYEELRFCAVMVSGIYWSIGSFLDERRDIWRDMLPQNREAIAGRFILTGENQWQFTDETFVAKINEDMRMQAELFRARMAGFSSEPNLDDGL